MERRDDMTYMIEHFKNIEYLYGDDAYVQIPNGIFRNLSTNIKNKNGSTNVQQSSFAYAYLVCVAFLYKYAHFVDVDNGTYLQNTDIKQVLGYSKLTKSIDGIIKKNGILEEIGLIQSTKDYPVSVNYINDDIGNVRVRDFVTINMVDESFPNYEEIKSIVKNRNYEIREPRFLFEYDGDIGTLYDYSNTHRITIKEFMEIIYSDNYDNIDFMLYGYFKSRCYNYKDNTRSIPLLRIISEIGIGKDAFYKHLEIIKEYELVEVEHKPWVMGDGEAESNEYRFLGVTF